MNTTDGPRLRTAGSIVTEALAAEGVEVAFGLVGSHILGIYDSLRTDSRLRHITIRHETNAGFMAHAYAALTGRIPVIFTTAGPGALNALGAIGQCYFQAVPVVMISGGIPTEGLREDVHGSHDRRFTERAAAQVTKASFRVESLASLPEVLAEAFRLARSGRPGPVYVEVPWDLSNRAGETAPRYRARATTTLVECPEAAAARVASAVAALRRVVFCIDRGVVRAGLAARVVRLAERAGAALAVSFDAIGAVPDGHPLYVGVANDFYFGGAAFDALRAAEFVVGFGLGRGTGNEDFFYRLAGGPHYSFYTDDDPADDADGVCCDLASALDALERRLPEREPPPRWFPATGLELRAACTAYAESRAADVPLHPGYVASRIARHVTSDTIVCLDVGANEVWSHSILPVFGTHSHIGASNWAGMGPAMPALVGAGVARPGARRLGICGDGGLLMSLGDYRTLIEQGGSAVLVVINDSAFGIIERFQVERFGAPYGTRLGPTDFAAIATAFGGRALRARTAAELDAALNEAFAAEAPVLVDVATAAGVPFAHCMESPVLTG